MSNLKIIKYKKRILIIFLLSTISFFLPIGETMEKLLTYFSYTLFLCLYFYCGNFKYPNRGNIFLYFLFWVLLSIIPAKIYWGQSFLVSLLAILPFLVYGIYMLLFGLEINRNYLIKIICILGKAYIVLYLLKFVFPSLPIGSIVVDEIRGDRVIVPGEFFNYFLFFYYLSLFLKKPSKKLFWWNFLSFIVIVLPMTRQRIALILVLAFVMIVTNVKKKYLKWIIPSFVIIGGFLSTGPMMTKLSQMTNEQLSSENPYDHIRELGALYYFSEFPHKGLNYIIGNGIPSYGRSKYGNDSKDFAESTKIYLIDIGLAAIFNYFGAVGLLLYVIMCLKFVFYRSSIQYSFCKYFLVLILGSSILSGVPIIPSQFMFIGICAYLLTSKKNGCKCNNNKLQYPPINN